MWTIQKVVSKGQYLYAVVPDHPRATKRGYVLLHRVVMENKLGRLLEKNEDVHHVNENKKDNSPDNLEVRLHGEHSSHHRRLEHPDGETKVSYICANCGKVFERAVRQGKEQKGYKNSFCSRRCNGQYNGFQIKPL